MYFIEKLSIPDTYFSGIYNTLDIFWVEDLVLKRSREKSHNVPPFNDNTNFKNNSQHGWNPLNPNTMQLEKLI